MERITSRTNSLCTHIRKLSSSRAYREKSGEFLCDSPKLLTEALLWGADLRTVVVSEGMEAPDLPAGVRVVEVPQDVMKSLSPAESPQGILSLCGRKEQEAILTGKRYVVLDGVQDPGNVGTILRTADAFGADGVVLVNGCADPYNPKTVRATMGAIFRLPVWTLGVEELASQLRASDLPLYGAALRQDTADARDVEYSRCAIAIGSEGKGLSQEMLDLCHKTILIPMRSHCESLNAAIAASVLLWEAYR